MENRIRKVYTSPEDMVEALEKNEAIYIYISTLSYLIQAYIYTFYRPTW